jgi:predicted AlkP superfamily pyrophosphatase or phosphodiesterase
MCRQLVISLILLGCSNAAVSEAPLLLISVDGLHPEYVIAADRHGVAIQNLRGFVESGAYASGVIGVLPTITYPSHTTMLTGVAPATHGIVSNTPFDPLMTNQDGWFWYAEDIRVPTLWNAVAETGRRTASVNWPVTVGERSIDVLLPEYWRAHNADDLKLLRALSRPEGILEQVEAHVGPFVDGYTDTLESDEIRTRFALEMLREHAPYFMAVHLIALDGTQHRNGPYVPSAYATLEAIDGMIGNLRAAALANDPAAVVAIVSDHGFVATHTAVHLRTRFVAAGLIRIEQAKTQDALPVVTAWDAQVWPAGGAAAIVLRDPSNRSVHDSVSRLLAELAAEPRNGVARVLTRAQLAVAGAFPEADFLVEFAPGYYAGAALRGDLLTPATSLGTHGYLPERPEMHAALFIQGKGIAAGRNLGVVDMRRIAPTLAAIMDVKLGGATAPALPVAAAEY